MSESLSVTSPAPRVVWEETLAADPNALVSQTPAWIDCICSFDEGWEDASRLYELPGGRPVVLPLVRRRGLATPLAREASLPPNWEAGGLVAPGGVRPDDVATVFAELSGRRVLRTALRPSPLDAPAWEAAQPRGGVVPRLAHLLELEGDFDRVWSKSFTGSARTAVRKAEKAGLTVERDTTGRLVPVVYELFERSVERWARRHHEPRVLARLRGRRRDSQPKFAHVARSLGEACRIWVAWHEGQAAAAIVVLQGANADYTRGMMDKQLAGPTRANYLLHRLAIEEACAAGCRFYNMGDSGSSASLAQFKTRFGAIPRAYAEYHVERLPLTAFDRRLRSAVKRTIRFRD